jgi:hypothetical protein
MRLAQSGVRRRQDNWHDGPAAARDRCCRSARVGDVPAIKRRRVPTVTSQLPAPQANFCTRQQHRVAQKYPAPGRPSSCYPRQKPSTAITGSPSPASSGRARYRARQPAVSPGPARGRRQERSIARGQRRPEPEDLRAAAHAAGAAVKRAESAICATSTHCWSLTKSDTSPSKLPLTPTMYHKLEPPCGRGTVSIRRWPAWLVRALWASGLLDSARAA